MVLFIILEPFVFMQNNTVLTYNINTCLSAYNKIMYACS